MAVFVWKWALPEAMGLLADRGGIEDEKKRRNGMREEPEADLGKTVVRVSRIGYVLSVVFVESAAVGCNGRQRAW